jgi:hypothetical protein
MRCCRSSAFRRWDDITAIAQAVFVGVRTWLLDRFTGIVNGIRDKVDAVTGFFERMYDAVVGNSYVPDMVLGIATEFAKLQTGMVSPALAACSAVTKAFADTHPLVASEIDKIVRAAQGGMDGILAYASDFAMNFTAAVLDTIVPGLGQLVQLAWPILEKGLVELGKRIGSFFSWVWDGFKSIGRAIDGFLGGPPTSDHNDPHENQQEHTGAATHTGAPTAHTGGMATATGIRRHHRGAARILPFPNPFKGLRTDEVPAILQAGEAVLNRRAAAGMGEAQIRALNNGTPIGRGDSVVINVYPTPGMSESQVAEHVYQRLPRRLKAAGL